METTIRCPGADDVPALKQIWATSFGSGDEDAFFDHFFDPRLCSVAPDGGAPVSAGYLIPAGDLVNTGPPAPSAMIYAVATLPEHRGRGYGVAVVLDLINKGRSYGFPAITICPSEDSLFEYYSTRTDLRDHFYVSERRITVSDAGEKKTSPAELAPIEPEEYLRLRETQLIDIPHIKPDLHMLAYQTAMCKVYGGGLYRIDGHNDASCAIIEKDSTGLVWIKELLSPFGSGEKALKAITAVFPAPEYIIRTPAQNQDYPQEDRKTQNPASPDHPQTKPQIRRFGMLTKTNNPKPGNFQFSTLNSQLHTPLSTLHTQTLPWLGLAFD